MSGLTIYFDDPYWVGVYERWAEGTLRVCRIVFGAEPKDYEVYAFILENWHRLKFSPPVPDGPAPLQRANPKRMQREIGKQLNAVGVGTKAQQAVKLQQETVKAARKKKSRLLRDAEKARQFALRQEKKKQKHKGH